MLPVSVNAPALENVAKATPASATKSQYLLNLLLCIPCS